MVDQFLSIVRKSWKPANTIWKDYSSACHAIDAVGAKRVVLRPFKRCLPPDQTHHSF